MPAYLHHSAKHRLSTDFQLGAPPGSQFVEFCENVGKGHSCFSHVWVAFPPFFIYTPSTSGCCTPPLHTQRNGQVRCTVWYSLMYFACTLHCRGVQRTLLYSMCTLQVLCSRRSGCDARPEYTCRDAYFMYTQCVF